MRLSTKLEGWRIIVTGGSSGIGEATVEWLRDAGAFPIIFDRVIVHGGTKGYAVDVCDSECVDNYVMRVAAGGPIDGLVTCAGVTSDAFLTEMTPDQFRGVIEVNLLGTFHAVQAVGKVMVEQQSGSIVTISSLSAAGNKGQANYAASKAGVIALTNTAALEWGRYGVRVNTILPGPVETPMLGTVPEKVLDGWIKATPLGHIATPVDIANAVGFLLSDDASHINGSQLTVSGGMRF